MTPEQFKDALIEQHKLSDHKSFLGIQIFKEEHAVVYELDFHLFHCTPETLHTIAEIINDAGTKKGQSISYVKSHDESGTLCIAIKLDVHDIEKAELHKLDAHKVSPAPPSKQTSNRKRDVVKKAKKKMKRKMRNVDAHAWRTIDPSHNHPTETTPEA